MSDRHQIVPDAFLPRTIVISNLAFLLFTDPLTRNKKRCQHVLVFLKVHRVIRKRTEDTIVALHPESIQGIVFSQGTDV